MATEVSIHGVTKTNKSYQNQDFQEEWCGYAPTGWINSNQYKCELTAKLLKAQACRFSALLSVFFHPLASLDVLTKRAPMALYVNFFKQSLFILQCNAKINFVGLLCKVKLQGHANFFDKVYLDVI